MDSELYIAGSKLHGTTGSRLALSRRSESGNLMGPLSATYFQLADIDKISMKKVSLPDSGRAHKKSAGQIVACLVQIIPVMSLVNPLGGSPLCASGPPLRPSGPKALYGASSSSPKGKTLLRKYTLD